jgi:hypothetical protein
MDPQFGSGGGDRPITIQDVIFRFYQEYFRLMESISANTDFMAFARAAQNAYLMVDSLFSVVCYYMDPEEVKQYDDLGKRFRERYTRMKKQARKNFLVTESSDKINNLYIRLANDRLKVISQSLGKKGILKEHRAFALSGEHTVMVKDGQILSDGDDDTDDPSIEVVIQNELDGTPAPTE